MALARRRIRIDRSEGTCEFRGDCGLVSIDRDFAGIDSLAIGNQDRIPVIELRLEAVFVEIGLGLRCEGDRDDAGAFGGGGYIVGFRMGGASLEQAASAAVAARAARMNLKDAFITANAYFRIKLHIPKQITKLPTSVMQSPVCVMPGPDPASRRLRVKPAMTTAGPQ